MKLENFIALTQAKLVNKPSIGSFENICFEAAKVKRGDIFFAYDIDGIELAVKNGAYVVVFENEIAISDNEIAWIKVDLLENALKKLLRFRMIEREIVAYECDEIVLKLSLEVVTPPNIYTLYGNVRATFSSLWELQTGSIVLFCPTLNDAAIFTSIKTMPKSPSDSIDIIEQTLFETTFIHNNIFYERQLLSPFFIPYLENLLHFYEILNIEYKLKKFMPIEHFEAVFINKKFEIKNFGTSERVLIFEPNSNLVKNQILFLEHHAPWANTIFVLPSDIPYEEADNVYVYKSEKEIINILQNAKFNFALVVGVNKSILNKPIIEQRQLTFEF